MDFPSIWKASSIALTGAFGILGLVKDFKDKHGKITVWGRVALAGILLSTGFGIAAQLIESYQAKRTAQENAEQALNVQRGLSPMDEPKFNLSFTLACEEPTYTFFCKTFLSGWTVTSYDKKKVWIGWPGGDSLGLEINFFVDPNDATLYGEGKYGWGNLWFSVDPSIRNDSLFVYRDDGGGVSLAVQDTKPTTFQSDGKLKSVLDIPGVTVVLREDGPRVNQVAPTTFEMKFKNGQEIKYSGPFEKVLAPKFTCFRFTFPPKQ